MNDDQTNLDASSRLEVVRTADSQPPDSPPKNLLQLLYLSNKEIENKLRRVFHDTFDMSIFFDYSGLKTLTFRVAKEFEKIPADTRDSYSILSKYSKLDNQGDGFRSFVGVVLSLLLL